MTVVATKVANRDLYDVTYENSSGEGTITAEFENPADGDKSVYGGKDDGTFVVTVATGYEGTADVTVTHDDNGEVVDSGTVVFGDAPQVEHHDA
jgi:hypothetical protein